MDRVRSSELEDRRHLAEETNNYYRKGNPSNTRYKGGNKNMHFNRKRSSV